MVQDGYSEIFNLRRSNVRTHIYKVPALDYTGEDIIINVNVVIKMGSNSGDNENFVLYARYCWESTP